jgi:hypothetical protein
LFKHGLGDCGGHIGVIDPEIAETICVEGFWKPILAEIKLA